MASETLLDTFVTEFLFRTDKESLRQVERGLDRVQRGLTAAGTAFTAIGGAALAAFGVSAKAAIDWEEAFTGVRKTVNATEEEFAVLEARLRQIAREEVPIDATELAAIAESAGQLGIKLPDLESFTLVMAKLGVTTDLTSEEAAVMAARFANILEMDPSNFENLASTVVDLGNNMATTESQIFGMALRLAAAGKLVGLSEDQIVAYAATLSSVGIEAEAGGSAFSRVWADMQAAVQSGSKDLAVFGKVAGVSAKQFAYEFSRDSNRATMIFIDGLRRMTEGGENVHEVLEDLGFANVRVRDALLRLSGAGDLLTGALDRSSDAWADNTALTKEAELRFGTTGSRLQFLKNNVTDLQVEVGNALLPAIEQLADGLSDVINQVRVWVGENPEMVRAVALASAGVFALGTALLAAAGGVFALKTAVGLWSWLAGTSGITAIGKLVGSFAALNQVVALSGVAIKGFGAVLAGLATWPVLLIAGLFSVIYLYQDEIGRFLSSLAPPIKAFSTEVHAQMQGLAETVVSPFGPIFERMESDIGPGILRLSESIAGGLSSISVAINEGLAGAWEWFTGFDWAGIGAAIVDQIAGGIRSGAEFLFEAVKSMLSPIEALLPSSDAQEGPLSRLTEYGQAIVKTLGDGIRQAAPITAQIEPILEGVIDPIKAQVEPMDGLAGAIAGGAYASGGFHQPIPATPAAVAPGAGPVSRSTSVTIERVEISVAQGDAQGIADEFGDRLTDVLHTVIEDFDDDIAR